GTEPQIPVQGCGWNLSFWCGQALLPVIAGAVGPDMSLTDVADIASLDSLCRLREAGERGTLIPHLCGNVGSGRQSDQIIKLAHVVDQRLLTIDVLVQLEGRTGGNGVSVVRRADDDGVQRALAIQHLPEVMVLWRPRKALECLRCPG